MKLLLRFESSNVPYLGRYKSTINIVELENYLIKIYEECLYFTSSISNDNNSFYFALAEIEQIILFDDSDKEIFRSDVMMSPPYDQHKIFHELFFNLLNNLGFDVYRSDDSFLQRPQPWWKV